MRYRSVARRAIDKILYVCIPVAFFFFLFSVSPSDSTQPVAVGGGGGDGGVLAPNIFSWRYVILYSSVGVYT